jgi:glutathione synthase/RimK-type ligase-like ATP-grasp enzyme
MINKIYILTDYKGFFGNKRFSTPYRSGMDLNCLTACFKTHGFKVEYIRLCDIDFRTMDFRNQLILCTSSEDNQSRYKGYIEDICYGLTMQGAYLIPPFQYVRAHNNKVFMEIMRDVINNDKMNTIKGHYYGCVEEIHQQYHRYKGKTVLKGAEGAKSSSVFLAETPSDIIKKASDLSRSKDFFADIWDYGRSLKHKGYIRESRHRNKFITQTFIPGLKNDWKLLIFGKKIYALYRSTRKNDFRASGSGIFIFNQDEIPDIVLDYAMDIFNILDVPNVSLDIGYDGTHIYLFEFQGIYFGSYTLERSPFYFIKDIDKWSIIKTSSILEEVFAESVASYINNKYSNIMGSSTYSIDK